MLTIIRKIGRSHYVQSIHLPISNKQCHALDTSEYASQSAANSSEYPLIFWSTPSFPKTIRQHLRLFCAFFYKPNIISNQRKTPYTYLYKCYKLKAIILQRSLWLPWIKTRIRSARDKEKQIKSSSPDANAYLA